MKRSVTLFISFVCTLLFLGSFNSNVNADTKTYNIGTDVTYPPFEFANDKNQYVGIDIDLMKAIAKEEGFKVNIKPVGFNAAVQSLQSGQLDGVMAGMAITDERKQKFDFSKPYYRTGFVMAVATDSKVSNLKDLKGKRVAIKTGTAAGNYALSLKKKYGFKTVTFDDSDNMYNDVVHGNSVACFDDEPVMQYAISTGTKLRIATKPAQLGHYGFAVMKGQNQELLQKFNEGFDKIKANGEYDRIVQRYISKKTIEAQKAANTKANSEHTWIGLIQKNTPTLLKGLTQTIYITILGIIGATIFGVIVGLLGVIPNKLSQGISTTIIYIFRGLPLLVLALFIYNGIPTLTGTKISAVLAGIITLTLNEGAYTAAFVRGGIQAVDKGQMEAARSLGLPFGKAMTKIILPQGLKIMVPSFINQFIITLKDTSILSIIGILELTQTGKIIIARNLEGFKVWAIIGAMYLIVITILTWISNYVQKKLK
ncbi:glutamine-binding protein glutamine transport system permease protein [Ligilactobacillus hayakitensis DSM 18933 = JCM 14209]|uniref:Glutamine-binding protein glutamine transport system permease protein n=1 Tax=Ligilactobacillus hayakitensis DSM 18933 = JCM 14209 TaxID=1423755 RepID=A0A0R1WV91_9LACO|nr:amino acid ABC transporter substrate-binding protein/permease [Ligilactobacillus hayakitensis]KRM19988.1 glutamine-binding protein glutamine transport system permease protein [Ligilactobacillus hayakitensis DSM 18933 = JCM 14209]